MRQTLIHCKACGGEMATSAKACPHCGAKNKKPPIWLFVIVAIFAVAVLGAAGGTSGGTSGGTNGTVDTGNNAFSGDCGITAMAQMGTDIIGQPTITVNINNTSNKEIAAIKFYAVPLDVYGEEITGIFAQNNLYTDDAIAAGGSDSCQWQFLEREVKMVKLYVYSVYFSDGTEWGNKEATKTQILKNGLLIEVAKEN